MKCLAAVALATVTSVPAAAQLTVAKTFPVSGARGVDPSLSRIRIVFSGPVKQNSWSIVGTDKGEYPEIQGDPEFESNIVCALHVKLAPDTTYSLGINSPTRKGFKSAGDETKTCVPYVLTFSTGAASEAGEQPRNAKPAVRSAGKKATRTIVLRKYTDKTENAFTVLVPKGWQTAGGIARRCSSPS